MRRLLILAVVLAAGCSSEGRYPIQDTEYITEKTYALESELPAGSTNVQYRSNGWWTFDFEEQCYLIRLNTVGNKGFGFITQC